MVIGSSSLVSNLKSGGFLVLAFAGLTLAVLAQDVITKKDGTFVNGQITGVSGGQVQISTGNARFIVYLSDVQSVAMDPPAAVAMLKGATPFTVVATLSPLVKQYAGLPAHWLVDAMSQLAEAYAAQGKADLATATYAEINQLYPGSIYQSEATAGLAKLDLKAGKLVEALAMIKPVIDKANQNIAPSPDEGQIYANAFLVYGQILQQQKQDAQALEAYLTVKTMFYQNPTLVAQAEQLAQVLRQQDPSASVD
jgi:tetratricopeptide (TPR) repeat protein